MEVGQKILTLRPFLGKRHDGSRRGPVLDHPAELIFDKDSALLELEVYPAFPVRTIPAPEAPTTIMTLIGLAVRYGKIVAARSFTALELGCSGDMGKLHTR